MKIAVYGQNYAKESNQEAFNFLLTILLEHNVDVFVESGFLSKQTDSIQENSSVNLFNTLDDSFNLLISIGGDGTILRAITFVRDLGIPIVGINTGRLGFLATIQTDEISNALNEIFKGAYKISERSLLSVTTSPMNEDIENTNFALNEIAISRTNTPSMITV